MRAKNIDRHFNSNYNILTGEDRSVFKIQEERVRGFSHI